MISGERNGQVIQVIHEPRLNCMSVSMLRGRQEWTFEREKKTVKLNMFRCVELASFFPWAPSLTDRPTESEHVKCLIGKDGCSVRIREIYSKNINAGMR